MCALAAGLPHMHSCQAHMARSAEHQLPTKGHHGAMTESRCSGVQRPTLNRTDGFGKGKRSRLSKSGVLYVV